MKRSAVLALLVCAMSVESAYAQVVNRGTTAVSIPLANVLVYSVTAPNGRYFVRVRALFGATPGPPSNGVEVFVGVSPPTAPANFTATVTQFTVAFTWTYGANSSGVAGWQLHAGSAPGLSDLAIKSFSSTTRSFTATAPAGTYYVRVYPFNHAGPSPPSTELTVVTGRASAICRSPRPGSLRSRGKGACGSNGIRGRVRCLPAICSQPARRQAHRTWVRSRSHAAPS